MKSIKLLFIALCATTTLHLSATPNSSVQAPTSPSNSVPEEVASLNFPNGFRRGINFGNMLEMPIEGQWGSKVEDRFFTMLKEAGFDFVRIPIKWSGHQTNGVIDDEFLARIDHLVNVAIKSGIGAIINIHHYDEMNKTPDTEKENLYKIWSFLAEHYKDLPLTVAFEIMNEPNDKLTTAVWNPIQNECIRIIRKTNPTRKIIVSAGDWGGSDLRGLILPKDNNLIASIHYYLPFEFTHQGASWTPGMDKHLGTKWLGTAAERKNIDDTFARVRAWSIATNIPILCGEFGAYYKADYESRIRWTTFVRETAEKYGFSFAYWEFNHGFGIYDMETESYREELYRALIPKTENKNIGYGIGHPKCIVPETAKYKGPAVYE